MNQAEMQELLAAEHPFVITMMDGFAIAIGPEERKHIIAGRNMVVVLDRQGNIVHMPYRSMAHIQERT